MASTQINNLLKISSNEVGTKEGKNNDNKYGKAYGWNNVAWCVQFVWWCFREANISDLFGLKTASCPTLYKRWKNLEVSTKQLQPGDIVFFDWTGKNSATQHVGICESVNGDYVTCIEGNTTDGKTGTEGVWRRTRKISAYVSHAYRPKYIEDKPATVETTEKYKTVDELAREVINGKWKNGTTRKKLITEAYNKGEIKYDYYTIQNRVNEILKGVK